MLNGQGGDADVVNVVDGDANDFAAGGDDEDDSCMIDGEAPGASASIFGGEDAKGGRLQ